MPDLVPVRRALLSVSDKTGLAEFATVLHKEFGVELISTGGTATFLRQQGLPVTDVSDVTGFPEMMDGRVKTLHPKIHGGLLSIRDNPDHVAAMAAHDIKPIDLLCINLYPFARTIEKPNVTLEEAIENIDIGGPAMIRSASKNHEYVLVVTSPNRYEKVLGDLRKHGGSTCQKMRLKQAQSAFAHTAQYDGLIAKYLAKAITPLVEDELPDFRYVQVPVDTATEWEKIDACAKTAMNAKDFYRVLSLSQINVTGAAEECVFSILPDGTPVCEHLGSSGQALVLKTFADSAVFDPIVREAARLNRDQVVSLTNVAVPTGLGVFALLAVLRHRSKVDGVSVVVVCCAGTEEAQRRLQAAQVIAAAYQKFAARHDAVVSELPDRLPISLTRKQILRYGENPHQLAALYVDRKPREASVAYARQLHGKELSYVNLLDADGALSAVKEFSDSAACIVKHTTPCGCAAAADLPTAFRRAFEGDPLAAFGGIVALNKTVDLPTAQAITSIDKLLEVIVAPGYADDALGLLQERWKNVRLLDVGPVDKFDTNEFHLHKIVGGYLVQQRDLTGLNETDWKIASKRPPTEKELMDLRFAWLVCKHVKSNAIVLAKDRMLIGAGAGQMDRPSAARLAISKAGERTANSVAASDAFFPFPDGPKLLLNAGVTAIIHPGGSLKDQDTIDLVNERGAALVLTGQRHFKH